MALGIDDQLPEDLRYNERSEDQDARPQVLMAQLKGTDKQRYVANLFSRISPRYDLMNTLMTGGMHHRWKRRTAALTADGLEGPALDIATGTGDLAFALSCCPGITHAVGVDLLPEMLSVGLQKSRKRGLQGSVTLLAGDALSLPFRGQHLRLRNRRFQPAQHARSPRGHSRKWSASSVLAAGLPLWN